MSVNPELRSLDIDIPSQPESLLKLSLLLAEDEVNLVAAAALVEGAVDLRGQRVGVIVSGGNVDLARYARFLAD